MTRVWTECPKDWGSTPIVGQMHLSSSYGPDRPSDPLSHLFTWYVGLFHLLGGAVGWGIALQAGRTWARFPMVSLKFFIDIILRAAIWSSVSNRNEYQEYFLGGKGGLTTFMCRLSWNLGASTSWNSQGLSRAVMGLLCLFFRSRLRMSGAILPSPHIFS